MTIQTVRRIIEDYVSFMEQIAADNRHGYSQKIRSLYETINMKSFDCSSLVLTAIYYAFAKNGLTEEAEYIKKNCSYTGNMLKLLNAGFEIVAQNQTAHKELQRGDLELNTSYHVAVATDKDNIVHARSSEGTTDTIDNSGNEIRVQPWYNYAKGWTHRLRFTGKGIEEKEEIAPAQTEAPAKKDNVADRAQEYDPKLAGCYVCNASALNVRTDAGTQHKILTKIPKGTHVWNFGYYTTVNGTKWLLIQFKQNGATYVGFASEGKTKGYLQKG